MAEQVVSLSGLVTFFREDSNCITKGELKFNSGFVLDVKLKGFEVFAIVRASMKDRSYKVGLNIDGKGSILSATCECPRGNWICSHMAAAAIHVNKKGFSKTDLPNSWIARPKTGERKEGVKTMRDLFKPSKPAYRATSRQVTEEDRQSFLQDLIVNDVDCPFRWLLSPEIDNTSDPRAPPLIEELLPIFASDPSSFLEKVKVTQEQQEYVAEKTKLQRKSQYWGMYRRLRLTASNFGMVLKSIDRKENTGRPFPPSLFKSLRGEYNLERKDPIIWGNMHEEIALKAYIEKTGNQVVQSGLQLFSCGYLGCSPDGIIIPKETSGSHGALEIKCPWKYKDNTIDEILSLEKAKNPLLKDFFLTENLELNVLHNYWHQVQAEMAVLSLEWAHFVVWTLKDCHISLVKKEENWFADNIPKLSNFYLHDLLPACYTKDD